MQIVIDEDWLTHGENGKRILQASLQQLPHLERLAVEVYCSHAPLVLPDGAWQRTVRQLAAGADLLKASLPGLGKAVALQELAIDAACQQATALSVLSWAAEQQALPLRLLVLAFSTDEGAELDLLKACLSLKSRHPLLDIQPVHCGCDTPLHSFLTQ